MSVFSILYLRDETSFQTLVREARQVQEHYSSKPELSKEDRAFISRILAIGQDGKGESFKTVLRIHLPELSTEEGISMVSARIKKIFSLSQSIDKGYKPQYPAFRLIPIAHQHPDSSRPTVGSAPSHVPRALSFSTKRPPPPNKARIRRTASGSDLVHRKGEQIHPLLKGPKELAQLHQYIRLIKAKNYEGFNPLERAMIRQIEAAWTLHFTESMQYEIALGRCINERTLQKSFNSQTTYAENLDALRRLIDRIQGG